MTGVIENKSRNHMFVIFLLELCYFYTGCGFFKHPQNFMKTLKNTDFSSLYMSYFFI